LATDLTPGQSAPEETEALAHKRVTFADALDSALSGTVTDVLSVAALLRAYHMAKTGRIDPALARAMLKGVE
jgi:hypothetical protein